MQKYKPTILLAISAVSFPYNNASNNIIYTLMDGFREQGYECEVICLYPRSKDYPHIDSVGVFKNVKYRYLQSKLKKNNRRFNWFNTRILGPIYFDRYLKKLSNQYEVKCLFFTHIRYLFFNISKICRKYKAEVIFTACEYPEYLIKETPYRLRRFNYLSKNIDKYIFETKTLEDYYKNVTEKKIVSKVVPTTMPCDDILSENKDECEQYISYCGSIASDEKDGLSNIIKAFAKFSNTNPNIHLKFIGRIANSEYHNKLVLLTQDLMISNKVEFTGSVEREEYVRYLVNSSLMVVAKPNGGYYSGGLSSKVIEYLYSGNPIVMTKADDYQYYLTHRYNVFFIEDNHPDTLYEAFIEIFGDSVLRKTIGENGQKFALKNFNYHIIAGKLLNFIV